MTTLQLFKSSWSWHPSVLAGCIGLLIIYLAATRLQHSVSCTLWYVAGVLTILLALVSPLDLLGDDYLFSAHMVQHLLLVLVAPPLLLLGISRSTARRLLAKPRMAWLEDKLTRPPVAWLLGMGTLWAWHLPVLYNATLASEQVHIAEHLSFLVTGTIFWWPVLAPRPDLRLQPGPSIIYLCAAAFANTVLGIILTFVPAGLYPAYLHPEDELGALSVIRQKWGLTPAADQQLGGLFMWVGGGVIFLVAVLAMLRRWYLSPEFDREKQKNQSAPDRDSALANRALQKAEEEE
jgi:putative membrane protein